MSAASSIDVVKNQLETVENIFIGKMTLILYYKMRLIVLLVCLYVKNDLNSVVECKELT